MIFFVFFGKIWFFLWFLDIEKIWESKTVVIFNDRLREYFGYCDFLKKFLECLFECMFNSLFIFGAFIQIFFVWKNFLSFNYFLYIIRFLILWTIFGKWSMFWVSIKLKKLTHLITQTLPSARCPDEPINQCEFFYLYIISFFHFYVHFLSRNRHPILNKSNLITFFCDLLSMWKAKQ